VLHVLLPYSSWFDPYNIILYVMQTLKFLFVKFVVGHLGFINYIFVFFSLTFLFIPIFLLHGWVNRIFSSLRADFELHSFTNSVLLNSNSRLLKLLGICRAEDKTH
jgi:hypothetical protein